MKEYKLTMQLVDDTDSKVLTGFIYLQIRAIM